MNRVHDRSGRAGQTWAKGWPLRGLCLTFACVAALALPSFGAPIQQLTEVTRRLNDLKARLEATGGEPVAIDRLIGETGLAEFVGPMLPVPPPGPDDLATGAAGPVEIQQFNMRLALTMLGQAMGNEDIADVLAAQPAPNLDALVIRKGHARLSDIRRLLTSSGLQRVPANGPLILRVPLVIWAGASLELLPGDVLQISRPDGAFVVNFGQLQIQGATIAAVGDAHPLSPDFVPFVTTAEAGSVLMTGGRISGLGFGNTLKFGGFSVVTSALRAGHPASRIIGSHFDNLKSMAASSARDIVLSGNHFRNMRGVSLIVSHTRDAQILSNLFSGTLPTNAIVLEGGSQRGRIMGNIVMGGDRTGIVVRHSSSSVEVANNIVWRRDGGGITLLGSDCGRIHDNLVIDNEHKGIEVRLSLEADVRANTIAANHSAGIWISAQPKDTQTALHGNRLVGNGSGLAAAVGERILLEGNDFSLQFPQFLSGDLAPQSRLIARNLTGERPIVLTAAGPVAPSTVPQVCTN